MSDRVIPAYDMSNVPISGLSELQTHLQDIVDNPDTPCNARIIDDVELQLTEDNIPPVLPVLLPLLTTILKTTAQDPTPLLSITIKLLSALSFSQTLTIADQPSLLSALDSPLPGANLLALAILHKAAGAPDDVVIVADMEDVVEQLLRTWLLKDDTGVGEKAARVLGDLLETDCDIVPDEHQRSASNGIESLTNGFSGRHRNGHRGPGHGRLWRLIFEQRPLLAIVPSACNLRNSQRTPRQISISQGRLLRILTRLSALNLRIVANTPFPDLFPIPPVAAGAGQGLLQWAALCMIDKDDMLMQLSVVDFFETFVSVMRVAGRRDPERDSQVRALLRTAVREDPATGEALRSLPNRTVEDEAEDLRKYIDEMLGE